MKLQHIELTRINGKKESMMDYKDQVLLVVNTACL